MNKAYRIIKNRFTGKSSVAHERAKSHSGQTIKKTILAAAVASTLVVSGMTAASPNDAYFENYTFTLSTNLPNGYVQTIYANRNVTISGNNATVASGVEVGSNSPDTGLGIQALAATKYSDQTHFTSEITKNSITNNGKVSGAYSSLSIYAVAGTLPYSSNNFTYFTGTVHASSSIRENTITNNGTLSQTETRYGGKYNISSNAAINVIALASNYSTAGGSASAELVKNTITNNGSIGTTANAVAGSGLNLLALTLSDSNQSDAYINKNTITNNGLIHASNDGISLRAVNGYLNYGSSGTSEVNGNIITNKGTINAGYRGINLESSSKYQADVSRNSVSNSGAITSTDTSFGDSYLNNARGAITLKARAQYNYEVTANILNNDVTNTGSITSSANHGIALLAINGSSAFANASIRDNTITNAGTISVASTNYNYHATGILLAAGFNSYNNYNDHANISKVNISDNMINNTGTITAPRGILINGYARGEDSSQLIISGNTLQNSKTIAVNQNDGLGMGIYARSSQHRTQNNYYYGNSSSTNVSDNTIKNSGNIGGTSGGIPTYGIYISAASQGSTQQQRSNLDYNYLGVTNTSTTFVNTNTLINTGNINSDDRGMQIGSISSSYSFATANFSSQPGAYEAQVYSSASSIAKANDNTILNSGAITTGDKGIVIRSSSYAFSYANLNAYNSHLGGYSSYLGAHATSTANTEGNTIKNSGSLTVTNGSGIELTAFASAVAKTRTQLGYYGNSYTGSYAHYVYSASVASSKATVSNNVITNTGTIKASADGIVLQATAYSLVGAKVRRYYSSVDYSYSTLDRQAQAIVSNNTITNTGTIDAGQDGIRLTAYAYSTGYSTGVDDGTSYRTHTAKIDSNTINNSGTITAGNDGIVLEVYGAYKYNSSIQNNTITNTGRIYAGHIGINVGGNYDYAYLKNNTVNNSGLIVSSFTGGFTAIQMYGYGYNNALNLSAPGFLAGKINLSGNANVDVTLTSGPSQSNNWTINTDDNWGANSVTTKGANPWFKDPTPGKQHYATIDPSAFAAAPNLLADTANLVSSMGKFGLGQGLAGQKSNAWLTVQGNVLDYDGDSAATLKQKTKLYGIAAGYSQQYDEKTTLGAMVGYNQNKLNVSSQFAPSYNNKSDSAFLGLFGRSKLSSHLTIDYALNGGYMSHDDSRFVNDNLVELGKTYAKSSYNSTWIAPEVTLSVPYEVRSGLVVSPNATLKYASQWIDGYTESGSNANATVGSRTVSIAESKVGIAAIQTWEKGSVGVNANFLYRTSVGDDNVNVSMIGDTHNVSNFYKDVKAGVFGLDAHYNVTKSLVIEGSGNLMAGSNVTGGNLTGGIRYLF